jgi:chemotaxis protein methyltransferase CheR
MIAWVPSELEWKLLLDLLEERFGLAFDGVRREFLASRLLPRVEALGLRALAEYHRYLLVHPERERELTQLRRVVTNNETYFFREPAQLTALADEVFLRHMRTHARPLRVLSAGCSSGEEAYSIAIMLARASAARGSLQGSFVVDGIDLNPARIEHAQLAAYDEPSLRACDTRTRQRYFAQVSAGRWELRARHRAGVRFLEANLAARTQEWNPELAGPYDAIFCRNVLIYFSERGLHRAVSRLLERMAPRGYLFLGHSESLVHRRRDVVPVRLGDVIVYAREEAA